MTKPPPRRVPSDDFILEIDGETYTPHAGEWVEFVPTLPVGLFQAEARIRSLATQLDALKDDAGAIPPDRLREANDLIAGHYDDLCNLLARLVVAWNWTDDRGQPLPQPDGTDRPFRLLSVDELYYLWQAAQGGNPDARKNGSRPSPTTSSATRRRTSRA